MPREFPDTINIDHILSDCADRAAREGILLSDTLDQIGPNGFCFASILLAIPFIQPIPLGPLTMICGATFIALGWQMTCGKNSPSLPKSAGGLRIHGQFWVGVISFTRRVLSFCRRFTRERLPHWVEGRRGQKIVGSLILAGGALLAMPMANLPLNNFFPALMIFFAALAWIERDGLMVILSLAWGGVTFLYFAAVGAALWFFGTKAIDWFTPSAVAAFSKP
ncbi:MAG: hypothetical protein RL630_7 [Verrucomicrobiota bacterium]|jgi:hypothetical protein